MDITAKRERGCTPSRMACRHSTPQAENQGRPTFGVKKTERDTNRRALKMALHNETQPPLVAIAILGRHRFGSRWPTRRTGLEKLRAGGKSVRGTTDNSAEGCGIDDESLHSGRGLHQQMSIFLLLIRRRIAQDADGRSFLAFPQAPFFLKGLSSKRKSSKGSRCESRSSSPL